MLDTPNKNPGGEGLPEIVKLRELSVAAGDRIQKANSLGLHVGSAIGGTAVLVGGTKTVLTSAIAANSFVLLTVQTLGTVAVPKAVAVTSKTAGTSFVITSADATDTSTIGWYIINSI